MSAEINYQVKFRTESETKSYSIGFRGSEKELTEWINKYYPILIPDFVGIIKIKTNPNDHCRLINYHLFDLIDSKIISLMKLCRPLHIECNHFKLNKEIITLLNSLGEENYNLLRFFSTIFVEYKDIMYYSNTMYFNSIFAPKSLSAAIEKLNIENNKLIITDIIQ